MMENTIKKFLEFNGKAIYFLSVDGIYYIAVRSVCDALEVDYLNEYKKIQRHPILSRRVAKMAMHDTQNRLQNMVALPEKYVYGWLFTINTASGAFQTYQDKCYEILYNYFHGAITKRHSYLLEKQETQRQIIETALRLKNNPDFILLENLKAKEMRSGKILKELDLEFVTAQLSLKF
jgi:hypothetical protein